MFNQMGNGGFYSNQEIAPLDAAFKAAINKLAAAQTYPNQVLNQIAADWEVQKFQQLQNLKAKYQYTGGYNSQVIEYLVNNFIATGLRGYMSQVQPMANGMYGPVNGGGVVNPFAPQQNGYMQMQGMYQNTPFAGASPAMGSNPYYTSTVGVPTAPAPATPATPQYAVPQTPPPAPARTAQVAPAAQPEQKPTVVVTPVEFREPVIDNDPDAMYGNQEHQTSLGTLKVTSMMDGSGIPFKYVNINLPDPCRGVDDVLLRVQNMYRKDVRVKAHIDIRYNRLDTINVPYEELSAMLTQLRKSVPAASRAQNKLKYLQTVKKIINLQLRGTADAFEQYLVKRFMALGYTGCADSETNNAYLIVKSLDNLIELSDKETTDQGSKLWQKKPGFIDRLAEVCEEAIKKFILKCEVLDPSNPKHINTILRANIGLTETDEGDLVDITAELNTKRDEFCKASMEDKKNLFGIAGAQLVNKSVIVIPDEHIVYTDFTPNNIIGYKGESPVVIFEDTFIGGVNEKGEPNAADSTLEHMLLKFSVGSDNHSPTVVINYGPCRGLYRLITTTDKWSRLVVLTR